MRVGWHGRRSCGRIRNVDDDSPLLRSLVDRRPGGQKRLPLPGRGDEQVPGPLFANLPAGYDVVREEGDTAAGQDVGTTPSAPAPSGGSQERPAPPEETPPSEPPLPNHDHSHEGGDQPTTEAPTTVGTLSTVAGRRRPARYGLLVQFESRPDDSELGRLVDSTIWINDAHPAYTRATASRSVGYHVALSVALALAPLAVEAASEHAFITQSLSHWGGGSASRRRAGGRPRKLT
jgi:hypothetical protein